MAGRLNTGGSQGEPVRSGFNPYFYPEVKATELITKNVYGVRLLPAFARDPVAQLPVSPTSWTPYRDAGNVDAATGKPVFTDWYYSLKGYKFIGNDGRGFLSPLISERTDHRGVDPLFDCYHLARNSKETRPEWFALTEKPEGEKNAILEKYRVFGAMNAVLEVDKQPVNRLILVTKASLDHLKEQLDVLCARADQPNDPDWPDFMLGDVTSPLHGLWGNVQKGQFNKAGMEASLFSFSRQRDRLQNVVRWPVDLTTDWGQAYMAGRYDISDTSKVTRIPTAEEILEFIVNDGFLPMELVRDACSPHWDIPEVKARRMSAPKSFPEGEDEVPMTYGGGTVAARTQPAASSRKFWVLLPGGQVSPTPMPEAMVRAMVAQSRADVTVALEGTSDWKQTSAFGIAPPPPVTAAPPRPAAPPAPPVAPAPAAPPAPPVAPAPAAPVAPLPPTAIPTAAPVAPTSAPSVPSVPTARPSVPGPAPRTVAPGSVAPLPAPGVGMAPPPPSRPAPIQPAAPAAAPAAPAAAPVAPAAPAAAPAVPSTAATPAATFAAQPLNPAEMAELQALEKEWLEVCSTNAIMDGAKVQRYSELSERHSAAVAAQN